MVCREADPQCCGNWREHHDGKVTIRISISSITLACDIFSPISDLNPIFMAAGCVLEIGSITGVRKVETAPCCSEV